ncbi:MAG: glycosyltransferase, partial [bacterium]|nr:glycosyltransferase [bacterium]
PTAAASGADAEIPVEVPRFLANDAFGAMQALERVEALAPMAVPEADAASLLARWERAAAPPSFAAGAAPLVSIITPTFNRPQLLAQALESIAAQRYPNVESVVVNDAGSDVDQVIQRFAGRLHIRYVTHEHNRGLSAALNTGIANATGAYVGYCDDDDLLYPDHVERLVAALQARGGRAAYADAVLVNQRAEGAALVDAGYDFQYAQPFDIVKFLALNLFPNLAVIHERALCDEIGPYDEDLPVLMDYDYWLRIAMRTTFLHVESLSAEFHQRSDGSNMTSEHAARFVEARKTVYGRLREVSANHPDALRQQAALTGITMA